MTGGLLQLVTTGIQDSPLILNPEVTFFKKVYKQYTNFSLCQNDRYLGLMQFNKISSKIIEKNGDLLYNLYFKIEIPYFDIIKTTINTRILEQTYNINSLDVSYVNSNCIILYCVSSDAWYLVPEELFILSQFNNILIKLDEHQLQPKLLPEYINVTNLSPNLFLYQIKDDKTNSFISILRVDSNFFEQYWLELINNSSDVDMINKLVTLKNEYLRIYKLIKNRIYNLYWNKNYNQVGEYTYGYNKKNLEYFNFSFQAGTDDIGNIIYKSETERYFEYLNSYEYAINNINKYYDIDITYKYCLDNFLTFSNYRDQVLQKNSIILLIMLNILYGSNDLIYTFWKKYDTSVNNSIRLDININDTNFNNEWNVNLNKYLLNNFNTTEIKNYIFDIFNKKYFAVEQQINNIFNNISLLEPTKIYIKLKTILSRFYKVPYKQINFNNYSLSTKYDSVIEDKYNNDDFEYLNLYETNKFPTLKKVYDNLDTTNEMNNLTPIDLQNIYSVYANDLLNLIVSNLILSRGLISPFVLWRNSVVNRLYRIYLDTYSKTFTNGSLVDFKNTRKLTFYHNIQPSNLYFYQDFKSSFYEIFYKNSWLGSYSISGNLFLNFKQNMFDITVSNLFDNSTLSDNKFHTLKIVNTYTFPYYDSIEKFDNYNKYNYKKVIYDSANKKLYVKYDNFYNKKSIILLYINDVSINYGIIDYEIISISGINDILFNSYYLSFSNISQINNEDIIKLNVTYNLDIPLVLFYDNSNINYPDLPISKFYLITKNSNNSIKTNNIINNQIKIDQNFINNKTKILNINYLVNNIVPPDISLVNISAIENNNIYINNGDNVYYYCISYLISDVESEVSDIFNISLVDDTKTFYIKLESLPISTNRYITSRNIYRTKANGNDFYLLVNINNNIDTSYIDNIQDDKLGIYYNNNGVIKYNKLPLLNNNTVKIPITLEQNNNYYNIIDIDNNIYTLPINYDNIKEIYIESLDFTYNVISDFTINKSGQITMLEEYSTSHLYYLVDTINFKENVKLVPSKENIPITNVSLTSISGILPTGSYQYKISFYNNMTDIESLPSSGELITILADKNIKLTNFPVIYDKVKSQGGGYNAWKIYRTKANGSIYYYVDTLLETINNEYIDSKLDDQLLTLLYSPYLSITKPINNQLITKPDVVVLFNLNTSGFVNSGTHKYVITYLGSSEETIASDENNIFLATDSQIRLTLPISLDSRVIGRKIYRTYSNGSIFKLLQYINNNTDTTYIDNISDDNLYIIPTQPSSLSQITYNERILVNTFSLSVIPAGNLFGEYYYKMVFVYNIDNVEKYIISTVTTFITLYSNQNIRISLSLSNDERLIRREIYRRTPGDSNFRLLYTINNNTTTVVNDTTLNISANKILNYTNYVPNLDVGIYNYVLSWVSDYETIQSSSISITLLETSEIYITLPTIINTRINNIKLYRTDKNGSTYKFLTTLSSNILKYYDNTSDSNLGDVLGSLITVSPPTSNNNEKQYYILKMPINDFAPNIHRFTSFSSDPYFINEKNMSDLNDFIVSKPMIMMVKNNNDIVTNKNNLINSMTSSYLYFYNIGFKIDSSSIITLNNNTINYLLPISTQQFHINETDIYYKYNNGALSQANSDEILQITFNPAFDEFNLTNIFIKNNYYFDIFIDNVLDKINDVLFINPDYNTIISSIDTANNKFINIITEILSDNTLFGLTSNEIINNVSKLNKFTNDIMINSTFNNSNDISVILDIIVYTNYDYFKYSHDALRLVEQDGLKADGDLINYDASITTLNILSPVFEYYNANKKISSNLTDYLNNVRDFFVSHINYVNNNIDYLNITNPNNYIEKYDSYTEIKQSINNNFYDYNSSSIITTLHPILEDNYYKIKLNNNELNNISVDKTNNIISTSTELNVIDEEFFYDSKMIQTNRNIYNNNKFNYLGLLSIDEYSKIIFNDRYTNPPLSTTWFKLDNNSIYNVMYKYENGGRYYINTSMPDILVSNPYELSFNKINNNTITLTKLSNNKFIQIINIKFTNLFSNNIGATKFLINNEIIDGYYQSVGNYNGYLYLLVDYEIIIGDNYLIYLDDPNNNLSWHTSPKVLDYDIIKFKKVNYYINTILTVSEGDIYSYNSLYYDVFNITIVDVFNSTYFYFSDIPDEYTNIDITFYKKIKPNDSIPSQNYVLYTIAPSFYISNNYIYYYYKDTFEGRDSTISLLENNPNYYILLINLVNNRYFILKINEIISKQIPQDNYQCWIINNDYLELVKYDINISTDTLGNILGLSSITNLPTIIPMGIYLPTYSFYMIEYNNKQCYYYYTDGYSINISDNTINYYDGFKNININNIYLVSNNQINKIVNQLLQISTKQVLTENFIDKSLSVNTSNINTILKYDNDEISDLVYTSDYNKYSYSLLNYNSKNIQLSGENEEIISLIINTGSYYFYRPVVFRNDESYIIPKIYSRNNRNESLISIVPSMTNPLISDLYIGKISNVGILNLTSLSPYIKIISITDYYEIYLKIGFTIDNLLYSINLWDLYCNDSFKIYFWTLFTTDTDLINCHINFAPGIYGFAEPVYNQITNIGTNTLIQSSPSCIIQDGTTLLLETLDKERIINYNYYTNCRYNNNYLFKIKDINHNSIINIKPNIELWISSLKDLSELNYTLLSEIIILVVVYSNSDINSNNKNISVYLKSEVIEPNTQNNIVYKKGDNTFYNLVTSDNVSNISLYYSTSYPTYVNNKINISNISHNLYDITFYENVYLEMGEIIIIDNNYFYVHGLSVVSEHYKLELIRGTDNLNYSYNGYYTIGNYISKDNRIIPNINYQNILTFYKSYKVNSGDIYLSNNKLMISTTTQNLLNINIFSESSIKIKLFYNKGNLYLFDNFVKLKIMDKLIFNSIIYEIKNIRDNQIYLNKIIINSENNIFIECILPYQPFEIKYIYINSDGSITSKDICENYETIIINEPNTNNMLLYNIIDNKIDFYVEGYYYIRLLKSNHYSNFENKMYIGTSPDNNIIEKSNINNKFAIEIPTIFVNNNFKLLNNNSLLDYFDFYYLQPVYVGGSYNYLKNIEYDNDNDIYYFILLNQNNIDISFDNKLINIILSSSYCNMYEYYSQLKISFNFELNLYNYNKLIGEKINVVRYVLKNNELIFVQNKDIIFDYGKSLVDNEIDNNINITSENSDYTNIYFYNQAQLNSDGYFINFDTIQSTYHLIVEELIDNTQGLRIQKVHLAKIIYPNKIKVYSDIDVSNSVFYLDRVIPIKINYFGEFIYTNLSITQSRNLIEQNKNILELIKKYDIRFIGIPIIYNNLYKQQIEFLSSKVIDYILHTTVYIDDNLSKTVKYIYDNETQGYYIISEQYILNTIEKLYTKIINYVSDISRNSSIKNKSFLDTSIKYEYIDDKYINEYLVQEIKVSKIADLDYKYELLDNSINFSIETIENYRINIINQNIFKINNSNRVITLYDPIDIDLIEYTSNTIKYKVNVYLINQLDNTLLLDSHRLFNNVKQLRTKLLSLSYVEPKYIINSVKTWSTWSILSSINKVSSITSLLNKTYLEWDSINSKVVKKYDNLIIYSYLTNDEVNKLSEFLELMETNTIAKSNYNLMVNIETLIFNNLYNWLNNPVFFLDVVQNINNLLYYSGFNAYFDGNKIIFNNDSSQELYGYITNEFIYDNINKRVYRPETSFSFMNDDIERWINKTVGYSTFGVDINLLLAYLYKIGNELKILFDDMTKPVKNISEYGYINPLKFIIDKLYHLGGNNKTEITSLKLYYDIQTTNNIYSGLTFDDKYDINYYGINSYNYYVPLNYDSSIELNLSNLSIYQPNIIKIVNIPDKLIINPLYPCRITYSDENITDNTYVIDFLNGERIADDVNITNQIIYPNQINFYSEYNIKTTDFLVVKEIKDYKILSMTFLGYKFRLEFLNNIVVDQIFYRNYNLNILGYDNLYIDVTIPLTLSELSNFNDTNGSDNNTFIFKNYVGIKSSYIDGTKQYLEFYNNLFNYNTNNTLLKTDNNMYALYNDIIDGNNVYYIIGYTDYLNVEVLTTLSPSNIISYNETLYNIILDNIVISELVPTDNNYLIPLEFKLVDETGTMSISPLKINTYQDNLIFYFTINDNLKIISSGNWYYFDYSSNETYINDSIIYFYDKSIIDIDISNNIFIPTVNTESKKSTNTFKSNNKIYIQNNTNYTNELELSTNISYIIYNKWTITSYSFNTNNNYLTFNTPYNMPVKSSTANLYYKINDIVINIDINLNYNPNNKTIVIICPITILSSFILEQWWIDVDDKITYYNVGNNNYIWNNINQTRRLGQKNINNINNIEKQQEFIYSFPLILNKTTDTKIYIYDKTNNDININSGIYEPTINTLSKTSNYINQDIITYFSIGLKLNYSDLLSYSFIQKNSWDIDTYKNINNSIVFNIPSDFIFINDGYNYYYKINNIVIDTNNIIISNGTLTILGINITGSVVLKQYYISDESLIDIPEKNIVIKVNVDYPYQYTNTSTTHNFYILPYTSSGNELNEYLYKLETDISTTKLGFGGSINDIGHNNEIILYCKGTIYNGKLFDIYYNSKIYYIVSLKDKIDTSLEYSYSLSDKIVNSVVSINYYQLSLQKCDYYLQNNQNIIYLFASDDINDYFLTGINESDKPNKFYLISYSDYIVENLYYDYTFKQNENMKKIITFDTSTNITKSLPQWDKPSRLFEYIRLYFDDSMMEELNEYVAGIKYFLSLSEEKRKQLDNMTKIKFNGSSWQLYLPLLFWFSNNSSLSLPTIALSNTELRLSWKTNNISNCLLNDLTNTTFSSIPNIRITLIDDFILLDMKERELFGTYSHEYIINKFNTYDSVYIDKTTVTIPKQISGLIKDIYFITKPINSRVSYYQNVIDGDNGRDSRYQRYITSLSYYDLYIVNNIYTSNEQRDYANDIDIIKNNTNEYTNYINGIVISRITRLINNFSNYKIYNDELLKMLMYMEDKYFSSQTDSKKTYSLAMYLQYLYQPNQTIEKISPIDIMTIKVNGKELFAPRDWVYFNSVIPNQKFKNSLEMGYYAYSFSLYPNEDQHSGHLNFTHFEDVSFKISSNENVLNEPYTLHILTKEYNILRIMSGMGSYAWI